jgi:hypothetical protein
MSLLDDEDELEFHEAVGSDSKVLIGEPIHFIESFQKATRIFKLACYVLLVKIDPFIEIPSTSCNLSWCRYVYLEKVFMICVWHYL